MFRENLNVTILDRNKFKLRIASKFSHNCIYFNLDKIKDLTFKKKFDYVIDSTGSSHSLNLGLKFLNAEGKFISYGNVYKDGILYKENYNLILRKELLIQGVWNSTFKATNNNWHKAENFLLKYPKDFKKLITHEVPLKSSKELFRKIYLSKQKKIKINYIKGIIKIN